MQPMTLREAVEIYRIHRELYAAQRELELTRGISEPVHAEELARWDRAREIVDAAVETWELSCAYSDALDAEPFNGRLCAELCRKWLASEKKRRTPSPAVMALVEACRALVKAAWPTHTDSERIEQAEKALAAVEREIGGA